MHKEIDFPPLFFAPISGIPGRKIVGCFTFQALQAAKWATVSRFGRPRPPNGRLFHVSGAPGRKIGDCFTFRAPQVAKLATVSRFGRPRPSNWRLFRKDFFDNCVFWQLFVNH